MFAFVKYLQLQFICSSLCQKKKKVKIRQQTVLGKKSPRVNNLYYSCLTLCDPWTVASQDPLSVEFSRQEYWSVLPCPPPRDLPNPGWILCLMSPVLAGGFFTTSATWEAPCNTAQQTKLEGHISD